MRSYAIGDIHGHLELLRAAHARIAADRARCGDATAPVVHLGDLVDRGPDCCGVIEFLHNGIAAGEPWVVLRGNHDRMFAGFLDDPANRDTGLRRDISYLHPAIGGAATLASYGVKSPADRREAVVHAEALELVPAHHRALLAAQKRLYRRGEVVFVHAGIRPGVPPEAQTEDDCCWIREPFLSDDRDHGFLVIHGHTAIETPTHHGNRVNIDSRAAYGGPLTAVVVEGRSVWLLDDTGRIPLRPEG